MAAALGFSAGQRKVAAVILPRHLSEVTRVLSGSQKPWEDSEDSSPGGLISLPANSRFLERPKAHTEITPFSANVLICSRSVVPKGKPGPAAEHHLGTCRKDRFSAPPQIY